MSNAILSLIGLCKKAGRLEVGEEPVGAAARAHHAKLLLVAADAADNTRRRCAHFAEAGAVPWTELPFSKAELGGTVGRSSCALVAVTDIGFASSLAAKLALLDQARYGELSAALDTKAQKALQRQKEQRQHEKNLREGKRKPWAAPPKEQKAPPAPSNPPLRSSPAPSGRPKVPKGKLQVKGGLHRGPKPKA
ncbi:ribosomal L7Ae/L30e/S12e/Gadd45 family protein [Pseudoflavonifractor intestinihominis]|uniref:Ribosomal L7Ae/L30e/S12e/Gadd45 family protein n=1 Tax=Pseudoflavonifractor intestinihominis TaxID=3133171 RepID=A0ABV1E7F9_9FIRM|nr:ribosomal L7Ae/L30e/S12e/Gadd45 family protein [uncultured Pseudoflavonifractor sp.]